MYLETCRKVGWAETKMWCLTVKTDDIGADMNSGKQLSMYKGSKGKTESSLSWWILNHKSI